MRGSAAAWVDGRLHQWVSTQHAQGARESLAAANGVDGADVRVITPDVGGGFGAKIGTYSEEQLLGRLSKELGRPVSWRETRSESMVALGHGRAQVQHITLGGTRDGQVLAYRLRVFQDCGAVVEIGTVLAAFMTRPMSSGVYAIPKIECHTSSVVTNTTPIVAYRGAGRPEAAAAIERAMDLFAAEIGMDPVDVRRRNLIPKFEEPHTTTIGQTYDVGDYETALDNALGAAGYADLRAEQAARRASGDPEAARHRRERVRRDHRRRSPAPRGRPHRAARGRRRHRLHRHLPARPGPRHGVVDDRLVRAPASRWTRST